jgi:hypothetical protein
VFRIGRKPDPWALLSWTWAHDDGTFGNRYGDPAAKYRVLYAATKRFGCFVETLARFRIDPVLAAGLAEIAGDDDFYPIGKVPPEWFEKRAMGSALVHADCADIYLSQWIDRLRIKFLPHLTEFGLPDLDASVLHTSSPRKLTQLIPRIVYEERLSGIKYRSKFGYDIENWAFFEPITLESKVTEDLKVDDIDLSRALQLHHLVIGN